jgi:hypothetical protein
MNVEKRCNEPCFTTDTDLSIATRAGVRLVKEVLDLLGRPDVVAYTDIADAFVPKNEHGEPCHTMGYQDYLDLGTDITCNCVMRIVLRECG